MTTVTLTPGQRRVVEHEAGPLRVTGGAGTGKTTALVHRYLRLAREAGAGRVLVLAGARPAALRFRTAVLPHLQGGFDALPVTTAWGVAFDVVARHQRSSSPPRLLGGAEQRALVRELLDADAASPTAWPTLHHLVGRAAFADEVAAAVLDVQAALLSPDEVVASAQSTPRWRELAGFLGRYLAVLEARGLIDGSGVLARACSLLADPAVAALERARHPYVLADDYEGATLATDTLLRRLVGPDGDVTLAGNPALAVGGRRGSSPRFFERFEPVADVALDRSFRRPAPPGLVRSQHPSVEAEAVAGELLAARERGVAWDDMAVLVRDPARREPALARALARHGIPVSRPAGHGGGGDPAVRGLLDLLRWADGDDGALERLLTSPLADLDPADVRRLRREARAQGTPLDRRPELAALVATRDELARHAVHDDAATLAHRAFRLTLSHLVHEPGQAAEALEERALDAVVAFLDGLTRHVERHPTATLAQYLALLDHPPYGPDPWAPDPATEGAVTVAAIAASAGREWHTVVVPGCVEGELPHVVDGGRFFDRAPLHHEGAPSLASRRQAALAEERRLFALACSRATATLVAVAAPEPGVLLSRFVEAFPTLTPRLPLDGASLVPALPPTAGVAPLHPSGALRLSASELATFEDCPLKHAYAYTLGVRRRAGLHAGLGLVVHEVLHRFLDPSGEVPPEDRSRERLHELAEACWSDDLAPYRPQLEQARRELYEMLDLWWEREGALGEAGPEVLDTERHFEVAVGPHRVVGKIDRLDRADDGEGVRVVDYKTGRAPSAADVDDDLQLATYHLAVHADPELARWGRPTQLRLLHLRSMRGYEQEVAPHRLEATRARIVATAERILAEDLEPAVDADCDHCDFHRLCPLWPEGRQLGEA